MDTSTMLPARLPVPGIGTAGGSRPAGAGGRAPGDRAPRPGEGLRAGSARPGDEGRTVPAGGTALVRAVVAQPGDAVVAAVVGPGGTGKTLVLDVLAEAWRAAGVPVLRCSPALPPADLAPGTAVLVDDAHHLDDASLTALREFADAPGARLVLAYRPWPRPAALVAFTAAVGARRVAAVVGHLDRAEVGRRIGARTGTAVPDAVTELVHEQTGGLPTIVDVVTQGLLDSGRLDPHRPDRFRAPDRITVSPVLAERLRHRVDALPGPVRSLLTAMAHGAPLDGGVMADVLADLTATDRADRTSSVHPAVQLEDAVEAARATGLLTPSGTLIPVVRDLFLRLTPVLRSRDLHRRLATVELDSGRPVLDAGRRLLGTGATGDGVVAVLRAAATEALPTSPALASRLLAAAVDAGGSARDLAGRHAVALALAGDTGAALARADLVLGDAGAPGHDDARTAAAAALAHRGLVDRGADLLAASPRTAVLAAPALAVLGRPDDARAVLDAPGSGGVPRTAGSGTLADSGLLLLGRAALDAATGRPGALSRLVQATALLGPAAPVLLLPDTPAALTAVVAVVAGQPGVAEATLRTAVDERHGGRAAALRHRLLRAWVLTSRGVTGPPAALVARLRADEVPTEPRDTLLLAALEVALAQRDDDHARVARAWAAARDALVHVTVDLTLLPVLGELAVAAARLGEGFWMEGPLADLDAILDGLGRPAFWDAPLAWARCRAAVAAGDVAALRTHAAELDRHAGATPAAGAMAAAVRCRLELVEDRGDAGVDAERIAAAVHRLDAVGLRWEAARLAGHAAGAAGSDRRAAQQLHALARSLSGGCGDEAVAGLLSATSELPVVAPGSAQPGPTSPRADDQRTTDPATALTDREREIGRLVLDGLTHKQIGQRLFISAKTVEHYVARMRQRLGVATRGEMFGVLQATLGEG